MVKTPINKRAGGLGGKAPQEQFIFSIIRSSHTLEEEKDPAVGLGARREVSSFRQVKVGD